MLGIYLSAAQLIVNIVYTVTTFGHSSAMQKFLAKISGLSGKHCIIVSASIGSAEPYQHINDTIEVWNTESWRIIVFIRK